MKLHFILELKIFDISQCFCFAVLVFWWLSSCSCRSMQPNESETSARILFVIFTDFCLHFLNLIFCLFRKIILIFFLFHLWEIEGTNCNRTRWKKTLRPKCFCKKCSQKMAQDAWRQQHHNGAITTSITYLCIWVEGLIRQNQGNNLVFHHIIWRFQIVAGYRRMH